jgi:cation transport ATPase
MAASLIGMFLAAAGYLPPVAGAITQEIIDVVAILNALRVAFPPKRSPIIENRTCHCPHAVD